MADYLMRVGVGSSFLDAEDLEEEFKPDLWQTITRGLLNPQSFEGRFYYSNLETSLKEAKKLYFQRKKREMAKKRRLKALAQEEMRLKLQETKNHSPQTTPVGLETV